MNKKFFSAVLMGALLLGGTFVSCQDYDDDIDNLQEQINKLASADQLSSKVSELQSAISAAQSAAEAKAATAQAAADAAKTAAGNAASKDDVKAAQAAAQEYADGLKSYADDAAAKAAQKVADQLAGAVTMEDVNTAISKALADYEALLDLADELTKIQDAIAKCATDADLQKLAERVAALETAGVPGVAAALVSVNAPAVLVNSTRSWAVWNPNPKTAAEIKRMAALEQKFPEIKTLKDTLDQGGHIVALVNPASADLTDGYTFSFQGVDGKMAEATVSAPKAGIPAGTEVKGGVMKTKAGADECFWTLSVAPEKTKFRQFVELENQALVIENGEGEVFKTPFVYNFTNKKAKNVKVTVNNNGDANDPTVLPNPKHLAFYSDAINVFAETKSEEDDKAGPLFLMEDEMYDHFIISVEEPADEYKYGITYDGPSIKIAKWPTDEDTIIIRDLKVIALGLNGSTAEASIAKVKIAKTVDDANTLSDREVALVVTAGKTTPVRWTVADEFKTRLNPAQLESVIDAIKAGKATVTVMKDGKEMVIGTLAANKNPYTLNAYKANGQKATAATNYKDVASFGFDFNFNDLPPYDYDVVVNVPGLYTATAMLTTKYPTAGLLKLRTELCDKDGVLQITGNPGVGTKTITYALAEGFQKHDSVTIVKFVDLEADDDDNWMKNDNTLEIYKNGENKTLADGTDVEMHSLYTPRQFLVEYKVKGSDVVEQQEFTAQVVSPVYFGEENGLDAKNSYKKTTDVEKLKNLAAVFGDKEQTLTIKDAIANGIYAAGSKKGQTYNLWNTDTGSDSVIAQPAKLKTVSVTDYTKPTTVNAGGKEYVVDKDGNIIVITNQNYLRTWWPGDLEKGHAMEKENWTDSWSNGVVESYYYADAKNEGKPAKKQGYVQMLIKRGETTPKDSILAPIVNNSYFYEIVIANGGKTTGATATGDTTYVEYKYNASSSTWNETGKVYNTDSTSTMYWKPAWNDPARPDQDSTATAKYYYWKAVDKVDYIVPTQVEKYAIQMFLDYYNVIKFEKKHDMVYWTDPVKAKSPEDPKGLAAELIEGATFEVADVDFAKHFIKNGTCVEKTGAITVLKAADIDETVVPADGVKIIINMIVKDKWGMVMKAPIEVVLTTK